MRCSRRRRSAISLKVQPYVLRIWEAEFPDLGVSKAAGSPRVYRRADVEQVARIKHLLLVEGLTLAGARRKLDEETTPVGADVPVIDELIGRNARERLTDVKRGLQSILELLEGSVSQRDFRLSPPTAPPPRRASAAAQARRSRRAGRPSPPARRPPPSSHRKRSA